MKTSQLQDQEDATKKGRDKTAQLKTEQNEQVFGYTSAPALELCYLCRDTTSALRIARTFLEGGGVRGDVRVRVRRSMSAKAWMYLLRLAIEKPAHPDEKRQCLELLNAHRSVLDDWEPAAAIKQWTPWEKRDHVTLARCILRLLRNNRDSDDPLSSPPDLGHDGADRIDVAKGGKHETWSDDLQRRAELFLKTAS